MMKQVVLFGFALIIIAAGVGFFMRPSSQVATPNDTVTTSKVDTVFTLYKIQGEVFYKKESDTDFVVLEKESIELPNKTTVKTAKGKATVLLADRSMITLKENTELEVVSSEQGFNIKQFFGTTYHRVETLVTGKVYEVRTPTTLAAVRGTKFAVTYDLLKKETKVAVTEHKVSVNETDETSGTSTPRHQDTMVEEGKTLTHKPGSKGSGMLMSDTKNDTTMQNVVDEESALDQVYEDVKRSESSEDFKRRVQDIFLKEEIKQEQSEEREGAKKDTILQTKEPTPVLKDTKKDTTPTQDPATSTVKKVDEETYFASFEPMFIKLFYVDEQYTPCSFRGSASDRVKQVVAFARDSGYPITSTAKLTLFAEDIASFCVTKDKSAYNELQERFDAVYPYQ